MTHGRQGIQSRVRSDDGKAAAVRSLRLRFALLFAGYVTALLALSSWRPVERLLHEPLSRSIAAVAAVLLSPLGDATLRGKQLWFEGFHASVEQACNGVLPTIIYLAAVLALPTSWRNRAWGVALGLPSIALINLVRVVTLMMFGAFRPEQFERIHVHVWQALVIALSMGVWVFWAERFVRPRRQESSE